MGWREVVAALTGGRGAEGLRMGSVAFVPDQFGNSMTWRPGLPSIGTDELGRPIYRDDLGNVLEQEMPAGVDRPTAADYASGAVADSLAMPQRGPRMGDVARIVWDGMVQGVTAPARASRGENVTMGDVYATALDYGLVSNVAPAPAGALRAGTMRTGKEVPNLRGMDVDEAVRIARREPHLVESGARSEGAYVGGPRNVQSRKDLLKIRRNLDKTVERGAEGGDWYDRYRAGVTEVTGGDPRDATWMSNIEGQYSAGVSPEGELGFSLKDTNSAIAYEYPVKAARPAQQEASIRAIEANDPTAFQLGPKTGEYARRINPATASERTATGVNDFRHARNLGYTEVSGEAQRNAVGPAGHRFMDYETALAVDRANRRGLAGRSDWTGEQIQAAPWVAQKADDFYARGRNAYDERAVASLASEGVQNPSPEMVANRGREIALADANRTITDFFPKHEAYATYEAQPYRFADHLPEMANATPEERLAFAQDPRSSWATAPGDRDAIYSGMRLGDTGYAVRTRPTTEMQGIYEPSPGIIETNPGNVARPLVAFDSGKVKSVPDADRSILDGAEAVRAYMDVQGAGAWHKPWTGGAPGQSNSLSLTRASGGPMAPEDMAELARMGSTYGLPDVIDTGVGATMTNFGGAPSINSRQMKKLLSEIDASGIADTAQRAKIDSGYLGFEGTWEKGVGSGAATGRLMETLDSLPSGTRKALDNNPYLPRAALDRLERDADYAARFGAAREDVQNARRIIGEGPGWIGRLKDALAKGAILPALVPVLLGGQNGEQPEGAV